MNAGIFTNEEKAAHLCKKCRKRSERKCGTKNKDQMIFQVYNYDNSILKSSIQIPI